MTKGAIFGALLAAATLPRPRHSTISAQASTRGRRRILRVPCERAQLDLGGRIPSRLPSGRNLLDRHGPDTLDRGTLRFHCRQKRNRLRRKRAFRAEQEAKLRLIAKYNLRAVLAFLATPPKRATDGIKCSPAPESPRSRRRAEGFPGSILQLSCRKGKSSAILCSPGIAAQFSDKNSTRYTSRYFT